MTAKTPAKQAPPAPETEPEVVVKEVVREVVTFIVNHADLTLEHQAKRRNLE